jgi:hypothetical protein
MKKLILSAFLLTSLLAPAQSIFDEIQVSETFRFFFPIEQIFEHNGKTYGYRKEGGTNSSGEYFLFDKTMNVLKKEKHVLSKKTYTNDNYCIKLKGKVYTIFNGNIGSIKHTAFAERFDLDKFEPTVERTELFKSTGFKSFEKSKNEDFVVFLTETEVRVFDDKLKLLWFKRFPKFSTKTFITNVKVSNSGEVFLLLSYGEDYSYKMSILRITKFDSDFSEELNSSEAPKLTSNNMSFNKSGNLIVSIYDAQNNKGKDPGLLHVILDVNSLELTKSFIDLPEHIMTYKQVVKRKSVDATDYLSSSRTHPPLFLEDGSYYIIGEVNYNDISTYKMHSTILVSKFDPNGKFEWSDHILRNQLGYGTTFKFFGAAPLIKNDQLHILYNDLKENSGQSHGDAAEIAYYYKMKSEFIVFESVYTPSGEVEDYNPDLSKYGKTVWVDPNIVENGIYGNLMGDKYRGFSSIIVGNKRRMIR